MDIDITHFFYSSIPKDYSASIVEIGPDAGPSTWRAALEDSADYFILDTFGKLSAFVSHMDDMGFSFGEGDTKPAEAWTIGELNALFLQLISGDIRESGLTPESTVEDWLEYEVRASSGSINSNLYKSDDDQRIYYNVGM